MGCEKKSWWIFLIASNSSADSLISVLWITLCVCVFRLYHQDKQQKQKKIWHSLHELRHKSNHWGGVKKKLEWKLINKNEKKDE